MQPTILEESIGHYRLQYTLPADILPQDQAVWLEKALDQFLSQEQRELWDLPRIEASNSESVSVLTRVYPPVQLASLPLQLEVPQLQTPTEELMQSRLIDLQYHLAQAQAVDRSAQAGDRVTISYYAESEGIPVPGTAKSHVQALLRDDLIGPGFYKQLLGQRAGADLNIAWKQENSPEPAKTIHYRVQLHKLESLSLPKLDQDFPAKTGWGQTWKAFFAELNQRLKNEYEQQWRVFVRQAVVYTLAEQSQIEIPEDLFIAHQLQSWQTGEGQALLEQGLSEATREKAFQRWSEEPEVFQNSYADLRASLALRELIKRNKLSINSDELAVLLRPFCENLNQEIESVYSALNETGALQTLVDQALAEKAIDLLLSQTTLTHKGLQLAQP